MKRILISPNSRPLRNGKRNAKNYPWWEELIDSLKQTGDYYIIQIGRSEETPLKNADEIKFDLSFIDLRDLVNTCFLWLSVDNFFPHFCAAYKLIKGIVLWGRSDPGIFGYDNINLLKDKRNLREKQFEGWEDIAYDENVFVSSNIILKEIKKLEHI